LRVRTFRHFLVLMVAGVLLFAVTPVSAQNDISYRLGSGDRLKIKVFDEEDVSGEFEIDGNGRISMPLIGSVDAGGRTSKQLEDVIVLAFQDGYIRNPQVSVEVMNYRPFYIIGEVNSPGSYPYRNGLTVLTAVAMGGGFTFRADEDDIKVTRSNTNGEPVRVKVDDIVLPGDVVRVEERLF